MKQSIWRRLACFGLALSALLCVSTICYARRAARCARYLQARNEGQLATFTQQLSRMDTALKKVGYLPEGSLRQTLAADIWSSSQQAAMALASLPLSTQPRERLEKYLAQTGDYAYYLLRGGTDGSRTGEEWETLGSLSAQAEAILRSADSLTQQADIGALSLSALEALSSEGADGLSGQLRQTDEALPEYASLIYDGPYSDHVAQRTPLALEGLAQCTPEETQERAADVLGTEDVELLYTSQGQLPGDFYQSGTRTVCISRQGGLLLTLTDVRQIGTAALEPSEAGEIALAYVRQLGLPRMQPSYSLTEEGVVTVNLACVSDGVICYPDLVKVGVALDDGSVVRFEGLGYAMNHHSRNAPSPSLSSEDARAVIAPGLKLSAERLVYIPTSGYGEVLCRELICLTPEGTHIIYDVNAHTGQTENLLLLVETENGILAR